MKATEKGQTSLLLCIFSKGYSCEVTCNLVCLNTQPPNKTLKLLNFSLDESREYIRVVTKAINSENRKAFLSDIGLPPLVPSLFRLDGWSGSGHVR